MKWRDNGPESRPRLRLSRSVYLMRLSVVWWGLIIAGITTWATNETTSMLMTSDGVVGWIDRGMNGER